MIKILQVGMSNIVGGTETFLYNHYKAINKEEYQFDFIAVKEKIAFEEEIKALGAQVYPVTGIRKNPLKAYTDLHKLLKENNYDVIHINISTFANIIPLITASLNKVPLIILHSHNNGMEREPIRLTLHNLNKFLTRKMSVKRLACSASAGKFMFGNLPVEVFENAIESEKFYFNEEERKETREALNIEEDAFVIGNIGRLHSQKNQLFLIEAFAKYLKINPNSYLLIVGEGELRESLEAKVKELQIESKVIFTGYQSDVTKYYQAMDLFCLPSIYEGLGIVGIEAQMNGLPCLFSDKCVKEVCISNNTHFLPLEINEWVRYISLASTIKNKINRHHQPEKYNIKNNIKKLELIYSSSKK